MSIPEDPNQIYYAPRNIAPHPNLVFEDMIEKGYDDFSIAKLVLPSDSPGFITPLDLEQYLDTKILPPVRQTVLV